MLPPPPSVGATPNILPAVKITGATSDSSPPISMDMDSERPAQQHCLPLLCDPSDKGSDKEEREKDGSTKSATPSNEPVELAAGLKSVVDKDCDVS